MVRTFPFCVIVGLLLGFLAGSGVGGGSLLMLWLTLVIGLQHPEARSVNLLFFLTAAGTVSLLRLKNRSISVKKNIPAIAAGCFSAVIFSWIGLKTDVTIVRKILGFLFLLTGLRELFYRPRNAR